MTWPVFAVDTTPPTTTLTSGPSNVTASTTATFYFISSEPQLDLPVQPRRGSGEHLQLAADLPRPERRHSHVHGPGDRSGLVTSIRLARQLVEIVDTTARTVTRTTPGAGSVTNVTTPSAQRHRRDHRRVTPVSRARHLLRDEYIRIAGPDRQRDPGGRRLRGRSTPRRSATGPIPPRSAGRRGEQHRIQRRAHVHR